MGECEGDEPPTIDEPDRTNGVDAAAHGSVRTMGSCPKGGWWIEGSTAAETE